MPDMLQDHLALDRAASARSTDADGHMRVTGSAVSRASVCGYQGREIPGCDELGLDPDRVYQLYRDAGALRAAVPSMAGKPLLIVHKPQSAADHDHELVVGTVDSPRWDDPFVRADLTVWDQAGIDVIEDGSQRALSAGYRYTPVMQPGTHEGQAYDGLMTDIAFNHVALVREGRVEGAFVGDAAPAAGLAAEPAPAVPDPQPVPTTTTRGPDMQLATKTLSRPALLAGTALRTYLRPKLAADAKLDLTPIVSGLTARSWKADKPKLKAALDRAVAGKLAADADIGDVIELLDQLDDVAEEVAETMPPADAPAVVPLAAPAATDTDAEMMDRLKEVLAAKGMSDTDIDAVLAAMKPEVDPPDAPPPAAADGDKSAAGGKTEKTVTAPPPAKPEVTRAAMDAAIRAAADGARAATIAQLRATREAERVVRPWIGDLALDADTAEAVYRMALDSLGVKLDGVHPSAYRPILEAQRKPGEQAAPPVRALALDAAVSTRRNERFPNAHRLSQS